VKVFREQYEQRYWQQRALLGYPDLSGISAGQRALQLIELGLATILRH